MNIVVIKVSNYYMIVGVIYYFGYLLSFIGFSENMDFKFELILI